MITTIKTLRMDFLQAALVSLSALFFAGTSIAQERPVVIPLFDAPEIDPAEVQTRVSGTCAVGSYIVAIAEDGSVTCEKSGTAGVFTASGFDLTPNVPLIDQELLWLDTCLTPTYMAGPGETALVSATVGFTLDTLIQGEVRISSFVGGAPTGHGNGYFWAENTIWDISVAGHIELTEGVQYRFGATVFPQGGGVTRSRLTCRTMVQIVRVTP